MQSLSRRDFLRVSGLAAAATVAAACAQNAPAPAAEPTAAPATAAPAAPEATAVPAEAPSAYNEAPVLAERVFAGELPVVDERLPENPLVIEGLDGIGNYGGTWRMGKRGQSDTTAQGYVTSRGLLKIDHNLGIVNGMADSWSVSDDGTEWTFTLRKGLKWSDGAPLTTEDFRFYYEDLILNEEYTAAVPVQLASVIDGKRVPAEFAVEDDVTFSYKFARPNALFLYYGSVITNIAASPAHFLKEFHPKYGDKDAIAAVIAANDSWDDWTHVMTDKDNVFVTPERPTHTPWINTNVWSDEYVVLERNPYFWEVDTAGNQLPYIDKLTYRDFTDTEVYVMWCVNGEIDCQGRHSGDFFNYTVLKEGEANGDYAVQVWRRTAVQGVAPNHTTKNARVREFFQERDVRIALSLSIDREEIRELLLDGFGRSTQYGPPEDSPYYSEKLANAYIEYDPDRANELLDDLGYSERDADGYRLWKDGSGEVISWVMLAGDQEASPTILLLTDYFKAIGLKMLYRGADRSLRQQMHKANEAEMGLSPMDRNLVPLADPQIWTARTGTDSDKSWSAAWTAWYLNPTDPIAEEPPADHWVRTLYANWEKLQETADPDAQKVLFGEILDIWAEEIPCIGLYGDEPRLIVVKNGFKGIQEGYPYDCCATNYEAIIDDATWYWDDPSQHMD
jgi:peptide/nickel transport system substrate-binding protein